MIADMPPAPPAIVQMNDAAATHVFETFPHAAGHISVKAPDHDRIWWNHGAALRFYGVASKSTRTVAYAPGIRETLGGAYVKITTAPARIALDEVEVRALYSLIHENLHIVNGIDYMTPEVRQADEAAIDAVASDLLPSFLKKVSPFDYSYFSSRAIKSSLSMECARSLRYVSSKATGGSWKKMPARAWRYQFFLGDAETKGSMLNSQGVNLGELCTFLP